MHNARFMLIEATRFKLMPIHKWIIISSSNLVMASANVSKLNHLIKHGTVRPNNFGHFFWAVPEETILKQAKIIEHHGYFRTLRDVKDYIQIMELLNDV